MFPVLPVKAFIVPGSGDFNSRGARVAEPTSRSNLESCKQACDGSKSISGRESGGGETILNTPLRRAIFLNGLIGTMVLVIITMMVR
jgi:hypothetical protein